MANGYLGVPSLEPTGKITKPAAKPATKPATPVTPANTPSIPVAGVAATIGVPTAATPTPAATPATAATPAQPAASTPPPRSSMSKEKQAAIAAREAREAAALADSQLTETQRAKAEDRKDAFQLIGLALSPYKLEGLANIITDLMQDPTIGPAKATYIIKYDTSINPKTGKPFNDAYATRFSANAKRVANGLPALSEDQYLAYEDQYASTLGSLGYDVFATKEYYDKWMAGAVAPSELADRIQLGIEAYNADENTKAALKQIAPNLNQTDVVTALLDSKMGVPQLKRKIELSKIAGTAKTAGLDILSEARAAELDAAGVSAAEAQRGYQAIGSGMQRGKELAGIYGEGTYSQQEAESEIFNLAGGVNAGQKRKRLASRERATFGGQTGVGAGSLSRDRAGGI
jgi:hypothetical protein